MAKIKIDNNRTITLLSAKKNPNEKHIKIGNYFGELTTDISKTNGKPTLKISKDGKNYYIREKFTIKVTNKELLRTAFTVYKGSGSGQGVSFGGKVVSGTLNVELEGSTVDVVCFGSTKRIFTKGSASFNIPSGNTNTNIVFIGVSASERIDVVVTMTAELEA